VIQFVEGDWLIGERIGDGSHDALSGELTRMFSFNSRRPPAPKLFPDPASGEPADPR